MCPHKIISPMVTSDSIRIVKRRERYLAKVIERRGLKKRKKKDVQGVQTTEIRLIFEPELSKCVSKKETLIVNEKKTNRST